MTHTSAQLHACETIASERKPRVAESVTATSEVDTAASELETGASESETSVTDSPEAD